jgi:hypothetical protein
VDPSKIFKGTYRATASVTFKALYYHVTGSNVVTYELVTAAPDSWAGEYVVTYATTSSAMIVLKGLANATSYESTTNGGAVAFADTGMSLSGTTLSNVSDNFVFTIEAVNAKYSVKNNGTSTYLVNNSNGVLVAYSSYDTDALWTITMEDGDVGFYNNNNTTYPYMVYTDGDYFGMIKSNAKNLDLWKKNQTGSTVYTTGASGSGSVVPSPAPAAVGGKEEDVTEADVWQLLVEAAGFAHRDHGDDEAYADVVKGVHGRVSVIPKLPDRFRRLMEDYQAGFSREFLGKNPKTLETKARLQKAAQFDAHVLILGETGTGKQVAAEYIHSKSARR